MSSSSPPAARTAMLALRQVSKRFGNVLANDRVDLAVAAGTIHALVGENGAGKSTAMRIAFGLLAPDAGEVAVEGRSVRFGSPLEAIRLGIGMVHQHFMLVETMTVAENVVLGAEPGTRLVLDLAAAAARIADLARDLGVEVDPDAAVAGLAIGQRQRVELLKALYRRARLLILDEPTAVLTPREVDELFAMLRRLRAEGSTIVLVTHKLGEVLALADEVTVMRDGRVVARAPTAATSAAELARWIVGRDVQPRVNKAPARPAAAVLRVRELTLAAAGPGRRSWGGLSPAPAAAAGAGARRLFLDRVSFEVRAGEILGIAGVEGNGQSELVEAIAGLAGARGLSGAIELDGVPITRASVRERRRRGMAHVPEDRQRRGLLLDFDLAENAVLGAHDRPPAVRGPGGIWIDRAARRRRAARLLLDFDVRPADPDLPARALSGGNQQKLVLGRELSPPPRLLLAAQPTRGIDVGAVERIHRELVALRDRGCAVLLVSSELEEVMALADRLLVLHRGRIAGEVDPAHATAAEVGLLMTGGRNAEGGGGR